MVILRKIYISNEKQEILKQEDKIKEKMHRQKAA
jgi:hypothetical protein